MRLHLKPAASKHRPFIYVGNVNLNDFPKITQHVFFNVDEDEKYVSIDLNYKTDTWLEIEDLVPYQAIIINDTIELQTAPILNAIMLIMHRM